MKEKSWTGLLVYGQVLLLVVMVFALGALRWSILPWRVSLMMVGGAVLAMAVIGFIGLLTIYVRFRTGRQGGGIRSCMVAAALSIVPIGAVLFLGVQSRGVPPIHDITTDVVNPPVFKTVAAERREGENSIEYGGSQIGEQQKKAYPEIKPLLFDQPVLEVHQHALKVASTLGWRIVLEDKKSGRIEAVATTPLLAFKDDVVIRITSWEGGKSRVDIRSASRVGVSDFGANAERITLFFSELKAILDN